MELRFIQLYIFQLTLLECAAKRPLGDMGNRLISYDFKIKRNTFKFKRIHVSASLMPSSVQGKSLLHFGPATKTFCQLINKFIKLGNGSPLQKIWYFYSSPSYGSDSCEITAESSTNDLQLRILLFFRQLALWCSNKNSVQKAVWPEFNSCSIALFRPHLT